MLFYFKKGKCTRIHLLINECMLVRSPVSSVLYLTQTICNSNKKENDYLLFKEILSLLRKKRKVVRGNQI